MSLFVERGKKNGMFNFNKGVTKKSTIFLVHIFVYD